MNQVRKLNTASGSYYQKVTEENSSWLSQEELEAFGDYEVKENITLETLSSVGREIERIRHSSSINDKLIYEHLFQAKLVREAQVKWYPLSFLGGVAHQARTVLGAASSTAHVVTSALHRARQVSSEMGLIGMLRLGTRTLLDSSTRNGVVALGLQYRAYKEKVAKGQQSHVYVQSEDEKLLEYLHKKGSKRSEEESVKYKKLLATSYELENRKIEQQFQLTTRILHTFEKEIRYPLDPTTSTREHIQIKIETLLKNSTYWDAGRSLNIEDYIPIQLEGTGFIV